MDDKCVLNGYEMEYDFTDADNLAKIKEAIDAMEKFDANDTFDETDPVAAVVHSCNGYKVFFDKAFGDGVYDKVFQGKRSLKVHKRVFIEIIERARTDMDESVDFSDVRAKYDPNRAQHGNNKNFHRRHRR